jgi:hypothetical protein
VLLEFLLMDRLVHLFDGGKGKEIREFESMNELLQFSSISPSFDALIRHSREKFRWPVSSKGRFDYGKERSHYVLMALSYEKYWINYK